MKLYKRVLKLHQFRNLGKNLPTELLLNSSFEKHGGLVILMGENNVGKSNILEALKAFNDTDIKLCNENDYFKAHEFEDTVLSLEEETILNNETIDFSCVDLKIQTKEIGEGLKELSKTLISYPFEKHIEALREQCSNIVIVPSNNNDYSNICTFVSNFKNLIDSYNQLKPFLHFYKELIKHLSGNSEWIKTFCQCVKEIIKHNTPNKECNSDDFFVMGKHKQNQLSEIYSRFKKLSGNEIKTKDVKYISKKIKSLDEIFKTTDFNTKFEPRIKILQNEQSQERLSEFIKDIIKDIIKEIDEKYPINENFKQQFRTFRSNMISIKKKIKNSLKDLNKTRKDFERKKESLIQEIEGYCKNQKTLEFNYDVLLDNIQQTCKEYIASHAINDESKDMKYMMCQLYLEKLELLSNSKIRRYQYDDLLESAKISLWEDIKTLDEKSGVHLFPKNPKEIKEKFEANKEKFKQSKNYFELAEYCRECNPYTAFQGLRDKVDFPLFVPKVKEYKEYQQTDDDLEITREKVKQFKTFYSEYSETTQPVLFLKNLEILENLENTKNLQIVNSSMRLPFLFSLLSFLSLIPAQTPTQSLINKEKKKPYLIIEKTIQSEIDSLTIKDFNRLLAIAQDDLQDNHQNNYQIKVNFKDDDFGYKLKIYDCRKSDNQKPIILSQQSTGFQWAFNFVFGFLYNVGSNFSFNKNIIYVMDEPATHLSVPGRREFRKLLKEYAHKNNVTLVLATHDPFLVDTDHLDEIRIVEKEEQGSVIKNGFSYDPKEDAGNNSDALYQIKRSFGVSQNVFHNPQKHQIIFVEGLTDYCYLSAFKLYFNRREFKNDPIPFTFLPISGLKKEPNEMKETIQKLCELDNNPIVLIDDDIRRDNPDPQNAKSEQFKKANEELLKPITILQLSKCNKSFKKIEDLFTKKDRQKYLLNNKKRNLAMAFKTRLLYSEEDDVVGEKTKENFKKLFEWIVWITNLFKR